MNVTATHLHALALLTDRLPELDEFETPVGGPVVRISSKMGPPSMGFGVHRDDDIGIMRLFTPAGGNVDTHKHTHEHEWIGVIRGRLELVFTDNGETREIRAYEAVHITPDRPHALIATVDTWTWSVSMPPAAGYPTVQGCPFATHCPTIPTL